MKLRRGVHSGTVVIFDAERGLGEVEDSSGERFGFHCTAIADGSRMIDVGAVVNFLLTLGHMGRIEATQLTRVPR
ncbi:MAG: cold shock domain-containing protein [Actinobacteria bacterium]|jgi:cold shock CspA family protein|nr:cold shock domain-containing protein [Actinomycetota bacterium]MCL5444703.1 cold shock domain-containing protein [Actinomycetota bacterium]